MITAEEFFEVLIASRELLGLFVLIDHFHFRVINPTARRTIITAISLER
jgi:hypothetical protein